MHYFTQLNITNIQIVTTALIIYSQDDFNDHQLTIYGMIHRKKIKRLGILNNSTKEKVVMELVRKIVLKCWN